MARVHRSQAFATESMQFPGLIRERDRQKKQKSRWKCVEVVHYAKETGGGRLDADSRMHRKN